MIHEYCSDPNCRVCWPDEEAVEQQIELHELWLGTEGADYLFENGKGE